MFFDRDFQVKFCIMPLFQEIYGIKNKVVDGGYGGYTDALADDEVEDTGAECVVCMSDMRDTLILPCRY